MADVVRPLVQLTLPNLDGAAAGVLGLVLASTSLAMCLEKFPPVPLPPAFFRWKLGRGAWYAGP